MAVKNITMKNHNGTSWDELNPKTSATQVTTDTANRFVSDAEKTTWDSKADGTHTHVISDITNLQTTLDDKASSSHTHTLANISGAGTAASKNIGTASGNVPIVGGDGKLDAAIMPAIAITDTFVVATQVAMLALTAQVGDVAVRTDVNKSYILKINGAATLANWQELLTPTDTVTSVAGKTGAVTLAKADVGLGNVDNTTDAAKPVSTAMQTALNLKSNLVSPTFTGTPTAPTATAGTSTTQLATTAFVQTAVASVSSSMPKITVNATQPSSPATGDFWYEITA